MHPNRVLLMLGACLLAGSAACADELGFVDCASHNDKTPVFAKARKSQDIVANVPCGERFKVIVNGFVFSEIQTSDGKIGFIYSNVVTLDRTGGTLQTRAASSTTPTLSAASEKTKIYEPRQNAEPARVQPAPTPAPVTPAAASDSANTAASGTAGTTPTAQASTPAAPAQADANATPAPAPAPATASQPAPASTSNTQGTTVEGQLNPPAAAVQPKPAPAPATLPGPDSVLKATSTSATSAEAPVDPNVVPAATPNSAPAPAPAPQPAPTDASTATPTAPAAASASAPTTTDSAPKADSTVTNAQPQPPTDAQPQPAAASAGVEPGITPSVTAKQRWEKPNPGARTASLLELFGGFAFARMSNGSGYTNGTNFMGGMGSFGINLKPWMQIVGDTSYSFESASGTKNVVYGNHYGPRFYLRGRTKWSISPFGEVLVGGSRADTTVAATGGNPAYSTSQNCFSIKAGGGVDIRPSRMFEIRLIDVDYYRTAFGTNVHQSNYWVSTGVVIRLLKPWWE